MGRSASDLTKLSRDYVQLGAVNAVPGKGAAVRAELDRAATEVKAGERALQRRQYASAKAAFRRANVALGWVPGAVRGDAKKVEAASGLRLTRKGTFPLASGRRTATVQFWVDGDTVQTSRGRVRVLGINTPELSSACGPAQVAKGAAEQLAPAGQEIRLVDPRRPRTWPLTSPM